MRHTKSPLKQVSCSRLHQVCLLAIAFLLGSTAVFAQKKPEGKKISSDLFGLFFEDINYAADGGLYAELVQNRSFEYSPEERRGWNPFSYWEFIVPGHSLGQISVETKAPIHPNNPHYVVLNAEFIGNYPQIKAHIEPGVGLKNYGFDGIVVRQGEKYNLTLFAKLLTGKSMDFLVSLQTQKGEVLAQSKMNVSEGSWHKYETQLTATANADSASLILLAKTSGEVALDMISLFPEETFKNRTNGLRADLAQKLADLQPRFIRFPGGCLVHGNSLNNMYRWQNTIGPVEQRKAQRNIWGYHQTTGLGYFEFFQFCEDIGAKPVPVLPAAVSCQNSGGTHVIGGAGQKALPMDEMDGYIQEVLDLIEWANGPATSTWGAKRAAAGHPDPFNLQYLGIGNEDKMTPEFEERFRMICNAVKEKYPEITLIGTSGPFHSGKDFEKGWEIANDMNIPIVDEHYYVQPDWLLANQYRYDKYDRSKGKVYLGEYASWGNKLRNAIAEAAYLTGLERNGDVVHMASYAPMLAKKGFTQWTTDMIFFDNLTICLTPNYYVQKLFSTNRGDTYFDKVIIKDPKDTLLAASCVTDSKTGDIILKLVNPGNDEKVMKVNLSGFKNLQSQAELTLLTGAADAENTFENLTQVIPQVSSLKISKNYDCKVPAMSLTVIRIKSGAHSDIKKNIH
ncbi:MAG: alpha-N-arabinofuranosidase [Bacteroidales bacterium]|nr:alpha-N-arabinofuranosidase [Bacteroidales bacterium]